MSRSLPSSALPHPSGLRPHLSSPLIASRLSTPPSPSTHQLSHDTHSHICAYPCASSLFIFTLHPHSPLPSDQCSPSCLSCYGNLNNLIAPHVQPHPPPTSAAAPAAASRPSCSDGPRPATAHLLAAQSQPQPHPAAPGHARPPASSRVHWSATHVLPFPKARVFLSLRQLYESTPLPASVPVSYACVSVSVCEHRCTIFACPHTS